MLIYNVSVYLSFRRSELVDDCLNTSHRLIMAQVLHMDPGFPGAVFTFANSEVILDYLFLL